MSKIKYLYNEKEMLKHYLSLNEDNKELVLMIEDIDDMELLNTLVDEFVEEGKDLDRTLCKYHIETLD